MAGPRDLHVDMAAEVIKPQIRPVWIVRLDIASDPVYVWTGRAQLSPTGTGDAALDGYTFEGLANVGEISAVKEEASGSDTVTLRMPGVNLDEDMLDQIINTPRQWQGRRCWIWLGMVNEALGIVANPTRVKSGLMDQMKLDDDGSNATVTVSIESHQAFISRISRTRYSRQRDVDPEDASQDYIHDLANKTPPIGVASQKQYSDGPYDGYWSKAWGVPKPNSN